MNMDMILATKTLRLHPGMHTCRLLNKNIDLTANEYRILYLLMTKPRWVFTRENIIRQTRGDDYPVTLKSIDVTISHLRSMIGADQIETVRGVGYRFADENVIQQSFGIGLPISPGKLPTGDLAGPLPRRGTPRARPSAARRRAASV